ncbi:MAG: DUF6814 family protein [Bacteroidia bacterium]
MNKLKRLLGLVWMLLGPTVLLFLIYEAIKKNELATSTSNDLLQWGIIITIFIPIAIGFVLFGYYAWRGAYDGEA